MSEFKYTVYRVGVHARDFLDPERVEWAMLHPPDDSPAALRSALLQSLQDQDQPLVVSWDQIRLGGRLRGRVIRLSDYLRPVSES